MPVSATMVASRALVHTRWLGGGVAATSLPLDFVCFQIMLDICICK
ncbi:hypothetical protein BOS5A_230560 [Bosea sp. EC-HK365B]|nr:hypothetical protein BOSE21B_90633 [Bosea sp. 21B]VVT61283.1 hypothetical protein BOS5A_230560 [Bosea sp. EC-HK365B]